MRPFRTCYRALMRTFRPHRGRVLFSALIGLAGVAAKLVPVDGNTGENAYIDMQLMSLCAHRLIPRSSFSLAAGMFCCRKNRLDMIGWGQ